MHFEILVEDQSGKRALDIIVPKLTGKDDTFRVIAYHGVGRIPANLSGKIDPRKRILLDQLPRLLRGYGRTHANYPAGYDAAVVVVCDLDDRCLTTFRGELVGILQGIDPPRPNAWFCLAIEEGEAWLLGDRQAVLLAYPQARRNVLDDYVSDSVCGTWEKLADAVYPGGVAALSKRGWQAVGIEKSRWAEKISLAMNIDRNSSPSFQYFRRTIGALSPRVEEIL